MEIGMLSCQQTQNVIDGKKRIILNPVRWLSFNLNLNIDSNNTYV